MRSSLGPLVDSVLWMTSLFHGEAQAMQMGYMLKLTHQGAEQVKTEVLCLCLPCYPKYFRQVATVQTTGWYLYCLNVT